MFYRDIPTASSRPLKPKTSLDYTCDHLGYNEDGKESRSAKEQKPELRDERIVCSLKKRSRGMINCPIWLRGAGKKRLNHGCELKW